MLLGHRYLSFASLKDQAIAGTKIIAEAHRRQSFSKRLCGVYETKILHIIHIFMSATSDAQWVMLPMKSTASYGDKARDLPGPVRLILLMRPQDLVFWPGLIA